jgi:hypothetical protein
VKAFGLVGLKKNGASLSYRKKKLKLPSVDSSFSCIEKGKAVASNFYQLLYYSVPPPLSEIWVVEGFKLSAIKCFELFHKALIAFSSTNHKREDTRYQFKIKQDSPLWTSILGVFHREGLVCAGQEFVQ